MNVWEAPHHMEYRAQIRGDEQKAPVLVADLLIRSTKDLGELKKKTLGTAADSAVRSKYP